MGLFELVIALLMVGAILTLWADRVGVPYPALLALAGAGIALLPGGPEVTLDPDLALALFVAPVLLDAAYDASPRDLRKNLVAVSTLAIVVVVLTIAAVAYVVRLCVPEMSWAVAITLGAIVAPPDASAATAVLRHLKPPHRLVVILEGESLFNDATALLIYRVAVVAVMTGVFSGWSLLPTLLLTCGGGALAGILLAHIYLAVTRQLRNIQVYIVLQFIGTFAVWILAEKLNLSAIITVVAYAMTLARYAPARIGARQRVASYSVWDVAVFVLNVLAFVLIGLQLRSILSRAEGPQWNSYLFCAGAVCAAVVLVRIVWVVSFGAVTRWRRLRFSRALAKPAMLPSARSGMLVAWCGMRGIVTLATALALPSAFPHRDLIMFCAFCVVLCTLVVQGMTLRPLLLWLGLEDDGTVERELNIARAETARAALQALDGAAPAMPAELLRREYRARLHQGAENSSVLADLQRRAVDAQRRTLIDLRARSVIGDDAFHAAEEEIDLLELTADPRIRPTPKDPET